MNNKDYFRLAKISLKSRKKTTKSTVRGISFGMVLLVPVIFIVIGIYGGISSELNKNPQILYASTDFSAKRLNAQDKKSQSYSEMPIISSRHGENISQTMKSAETVKFEQIKAKNSKPYFTIENEESKQIELSYKISNEFFYINNIAAIIDLEKSTNNSFITKKTKTLNNGNVFIEGGEFVDGGKSQVVVSELLLEILNIQAKDVIGKNLSVSYNAVSSDYYNGIQIDTDNIIENNTNNVDNYLREKEINFFYNYQVVGIIKKQITLNAMVLDKVNNLPSIMSNLFFLSDKSLYYNGDSVLEPTITSLIAEEEIDNQTSYINVATYSQSDFTQLNQEYIGLGANGFNSHIENKYSNDRGKKYEKYATETYLFDFNAFAHLDAGVKLITRQISSLHFKDIVSNLSGDIGGSIYAQIKMIYDIFLYIIMFLSIMGGIIFFAAIVNLFNSIVHSVDSRKHYLAVMRAVGAKNSTIPKLYFAESLTLFKKSFLWIIIFGGLICTGIKIALDEAFKYINKSGIVPFKMGIKASYIPISIGVGFAVLLIIGLVFSYTCSRKVSKKPIMTILGDV